ncbi:hypothetical protein JCM8097_008226 [Rhodosporidiobolus ruineniae]
MHFIVSLLPVLTLGALFVDAAPAPNPDPAWYLAPTVTSPSSTTTTPSATKWYLAPTTTASRYSSSSSVAAASSSSAALVPAPHTTARTTLRLDWTPVASNNTSSTTTATTTAAATATKRYPARRDVAKRFPAIAHPKANENYLLVTEGFAALNGGHEALCGRTVALHRVKLDAFTPYWNNVEAQKFVIIGQPSGGWLQDGVLISASWSPVGALVNTEVDVEFL